MTDAGLSMSTSLRLGVFCLSPTLSMELYRHLNHSLACTVFTYGQKLHAVANGIMNAFSSLGKCKKSFCFLDGVCVSPNQMYETGSGCRGTGGLPGSTGLSLTNRCVLKCTSGTMSASVT